ncbi:hypothetical protein [Siminovitchia sp. 179-K 8D1 HS]|uniref:hypothetical protein n=1 Tax=Siminovitchia sp. 179-K 8D1 HS TaxID=3142385 RepID=UPI0039A2A32A
MDLDNFIKNSIKNPKQVGSKVFVYNGNGELVETYDAVELGKAYFSMSNDIFFDIYGFNFVPKGIWWERSKRAAGKM